MLLPFLSVRSYFKAAGLSGVEQAGVALKSGARRRDDGGFESSERDFCGLNMEVGMLRDC